VAIVVDELAFELPVTPAPDSAQIPRPDSNQLPNAQLRCEPCEILDGGRSGVDPALFTAALKIVRRVPARSDRLRPSNPASVDSPFAGVTDELGPPLPQSGQRTVPHVDGHLIKPDGHPGNLTLGGLMPAGSAVQFWVTVVKYPSREEVVLAVQSQPCVNE
jgi:hypothetical protein